MRLEIGGWTIAETILVLASLVVTTSVVSLFRQHVLTCFHLLAREFIPARRRLPRSPIPRLLSAVCGLLILSACIPDPMSNQGRIEPFEPSDAFPFDQSARPALEGVVSRQEEPELTVLETGRQDGQLVETMPLEITDELLTRGAEQYQIYCAPCHDAAGSGAGAVVQRGFPAPPSLLEEDLRQAPDGYLFDVITNGSGLMFSYAPQVEPTDRWAIIAHIRRLQQTEDGGQGTGDGRRETVEGERRTTAKAVITNQISNLQSLSSNLYPLSSTLHAPHSTLQPPNLPHPFFPAYLVAYLFWLGISLGCLGWLLFQNMTGGLWGFTIQRVLEAGARTLPLMALLFIPLLFGLPTLYPWSTGTTAPGDALWLPKSSYLNVPFFIVRAVVYFAIWIALALIVPRWSYSSDDKPEPSSLVWQNRVRASAVGLLLFALAANFAAVDWLMSLEPQWFSSLFGWLAIARHALGALAFAILVLALARWPGRRPATASGPQSPVSQSPISNPQSSLASLLTPQVTNDLGTIFLATLLTWAYLALIQFMVIWTANLPEEVIYYLKRTQNNWLWVVVALLALYISLPVLLLLLRPVKRSLTLLAAIAALILLMRFLHIYWLVMPVFHPTISLHWLHVVLPLAIGAIWLALFTWQLRRHPLLPQNHPKLQSSISNLATHHFEQ